jgi:transcriptional regulator with XRE-family HTH domain
MTQNRLSGWRLRETRIAQAMSREGLAERAGLTLRTIRDLEDGKRQPLHRTWQALARALGISMEDLTPLPEKKKPKRPSGRPKKP